MPQVSLFNSFTSKTSPSLIHEIILSSTIVIIKLLRIDPCVPDSLSGDDGDGCHAWSGASGADDGDAGGDEGGPGG